MLTITKYLKLHSLEQLLGSRCEDDHISDFRFYLRNRMVQIQLKNDFFIKY